MKKNLLVLALVSCVGFTSVAHAENEIEVIEITGKTSTSKLKKMLLRAEKGFYESYNSHVPKEFQIECDYRKRNLGSNLRERICEPNFVAMVKAKEGIMSSLPPDMLTKAAGLRDGETLDETDVMATKQKQLEELLMKTIQQNPEVATGFLNMKKIQVELANRGK